MKRSSIKYLALVLILILGLTATGAMADLKYWCVRRHNIALRKVQGSERIAVWLDISPLMLRLACKI